ncbi:MAG: 4-hydroxy-tetrahydrodipicolinate synthase [Ruminococcaceae bacterium]|nr:4-hydroxy-tetrahydrodipicolinate synthase [Oscillospiraceae bacterium]
MKRETPLFQGAATAIITPLTERGIDYKQFERLITWQIDSGIDAIVVCGTTGEGSTLTDAEHKKAIEFVVKTVGGAVPVIAGTGSNETVYAIELTEFSTKVGADGVLVVTPYYNKATQNGLVLTYNLIADHSGVPVVLYNVPSRTGVNIEPATYVRLAEHPMITGIKEASGNLSKIVETFSLVGDKLDIYSGNDDQVVPILSLGGKGVISVLSNLLPKETSEMCKLYMNGKVAQAAKMQCDYFSLINALFCEVNPIPVKAAMSLMGYCENYLRLPLTPMEEGNFAKLKAIMEGHGII